MQINQRRVMTEQIRGASSVEYARALADAPPALRVRLLLTGRSLKASLIEIFQEKFAFWDKLSWSIIGLWAGEVDQKYLADTRFLARSLLQVVGRQ